MDAEKAAKAAKIKAELAAEAERVRAKGKAAYEAASKKTPKSDADIEKLKQSMGNAEKKKKGDLGKKAKAAKMAEITKAPASVKPYDFEAARARNPHVNVTSKPQEPYRGGIGSDTESGLTKNFKAPKKSVPITDETPTEGFKNVEKARASKTIAQEVAEIKPNIPTKPLAGQGSMEGKPVAKVIDTRGAHIARRPGGAPPAGVPERRVVVEGPKTAPAAAPAVAPKVAAPAAVPPKVAAPKAAAPVGPPKMTSADIFGAPEKPPVPKMTAADLFSAPEKKLSLGEKVASKLKGGAKALAKGAWQTVKSELKAADPTGPFRELKAAKGASRTSFEVAKAGIKGGYRLGKGVAKGIGEGILVDFAGQQGYNVGSAIESAAGNEGELAKLRTSGRKQGLTVSGGDSGMSAVGKGLVGALTLGSVDLGKDIKVTEPAGAQSLREKRMARGEAKFRAKKGSNSDGFSEEAYQKLKKSASRNVIKGSYLG